MISLVIAGCDDYGDVRPRLHLWLFSVLSSNVEVGNSNNDSNNDEDESQDEDEDEGDDGDDHQVHVHLSQYYNMTGQQKAITAVKWSLFMVFLILVSVLSPCNAKISDKRLCYDKSCSVVISKGKTVIPYNSKDHDVLSFPINTDVKIFSKQAGNRPDLWGVEIEGKRGYVPSKFIREMKILHTKLEYIVPTEEFNKEQVKNIEKIERLDKSNRENISISEQVDGSKIILPENSSKNNFEEDIVPHQVSPSYESIYDGTLLPQENEESPPPSYSTQTIQNNIKVDEQVRLNVYPNLISSTFPTLSDIWSSIEDDSEEEDTEDASSDDIVDASSDDIDASLDYIVDDEINKIVFQNEKTDESSLNSKEKSDLLSENIVLDYIIEGVSNNFLPQEANKIVNNNETDSLIQPTINDTDSFVQDEENKIDSLIQHKVNEIDSSVQPEENGTVSLTQNKVSEIDSSVQPEENGTVSLTQNKVSEIDSSVQPEENGTVSLTQNKVNEIDLSIQYEGNETDSLTQQKKNDIDSSVQRKGNETNSYIQHKAKEIDSLIQDKLIKIIDKNEISEKDNTINNVEAIDSIDVDNEENVIQSSASKNLSTDESSIVENIKSVLEDLQNYIVPKQDETVVVTNSSISSENHENVTINDEKFKLDEHKIENTTSIDSVSVVNSSIFKVPLKQDVDEELVASPDEVVLPSEESISRILFEKENKEENKDSVEIRNNLTTHDSTFKKLNLTDNLEKQFKVNDNLMDRNNNLNDNKSFAVNEHKNIHNNSAIENLESNLQSMDSNHEHIIDIPSTSSFGEFLGNRNLLNAKKESDEIHLDKIVIDDITETTTSSEKVKNSSSEVKQEEDNGSFEEKPSINSIKKIVLPLDTCDKSYDYSNDHTKHQYSVDENAVINVNKVSNSSDTLLYICITALTILLFSLGYHFIENKRRDAYLISKINNLEKDLLVTKKECIMLDENFKSTKAKLDCIEDQSFGSNEMVLSLKAELSASENVRAELEDQIASLEKELESTSEAGLELECMLREILSSHNEENNPLAKSIEDLQHRLNDQQMANESLTNTLAIKSQENKTLAEDLKLNLKNIGELKSEVTKLTDELKTQISKRIHLEQNLSDQVQKLELQVKALTEDKSHLRKQLRLKELELKELMEVTEHMHTNNLDLDKLYEVSQIKAEAAQLLEERDELKIKLNEEEGARELLEEHVKSIMEDITYLREQCKVSEKEKKDAETRLEVLTKFFEEKETQRQKEEAIWLEKQGEVSSTVDRLQTMQNEILNYKQQIEMLKREILDQEREYKNQISVLETKAHEQWVSARQNERRLEEVKAESSQLRNRLTLVEKNINEGDSEVKLHRVQTANGDSHPLFAAPETSNSPLMFGASGPAPPPPPPGSFLYGPGSFAPPPPFLPPPPLAGSRPPPLGGGRLSSPPPGNGGCANASSNIAGSEASGNPAGGLPLSPPPALLPFPHHPFHHHRSPPLLSPFTNDVPPPPGSLLHPLHHHLHRHMPPPPPSALLHTHQQEQLQPPYPGSAHHAWGEEVPPPAPTRNPSSFHPQQRDQRAGRNHKGSLHSSGESLDKSHHGKV